ncbi:transglutaminase-like domain-containing protein [Blautia schinkii]|nr:transglutaminase-like domain-containing protein [Blautia schinkii]
MKKYWKKWIAILLVVCCLGISIPAAPVQAAAFSPAALSTGKVYITDDPEVNYMIEQVCRKIIKPKASKIRNIAAVYAYTAKLSVHYQSKYQKGKIKFNLGNKTVKKNIASLDKKNKALIKSGKAAYISKMSKNTCRCTGSSWDVRHFLLTGSGGCDETAHVVHALLGRIGVQSYCFWGRFGSGGHCWNAVKYGGKYYYLDADSANYNYVTNTDRKVHYDEVFMKSASDLKKLGYRIDAKDAAKYPKCEKKSLKVNTKSFPV